MSDRQTDRQSGKQTNWNRDCTINDFYNIFNDQVCSYQYHNFPENRSQIRLPDCLMECQIPENSYSTNEAGANRILSLSMDLFACLRLSASLDSLTGLLSTA